MDQKRYETLALIEAAVEMVPAQRGRQLVMVARDYAADGDLSTARRVISNLHDYFSSGRAYLEMRDDSLLRQALLDLADVVPGLAGVHSRFAIPKQETNMADEPIDPLPPTPPAIERVITEEDGKTFRARACLVKTIEGSFATANFRGFSFPNPVPVYSIDGRRIGFAELEWDGKQLMAEVVIDYSTPERLMIEIGHKLYARPVGVVVLKNTDDPCIDFQEPIEIARARVEKVLLTTTAPRDSRIDPLGKPVVG